MNLKVLTLLLLLSLSWSCTKDVIQTNCIIDEMNLIEKCPGRNAGCVFYIEAFSWNEEAYYAYGSHVADVEFAPFDCSGEPICDLPQSNTCQRFLRERINLGIVGYVND